MTTLHDRLSDLADEAPTPSPTPDLWDRARRYHRRRRAGTLAIVVCAALLLGLLGGVSWHRSAPPVQPATGSVGLPDRLWKPSPWLPSTDRPGRLVAMVETDRGSWSGMHPGVVGVSATTGKYSFVDLPGADLAATGPPVVSPDGRHVAYWLTGETTGTPNTRSGRPVAGLAVFDTETGDVRRHWIPTAHGLSSDFLTWADADTVVYSAGQIVGGDDASDMDQSSSRSYTVTAWSLWGEPAPVPGVREGAALEGAAYGRVLMDTGSERPDRAHRLIDLEDPSRSRFAPHPEPGGVIGMLHFVAPDSSGHRLALVPGPRNPGTVLAGPVGDLHAVPNTRGTWGVVDWLDPDTMVTMRLVRKGPTGPNGLYRVSVSTGSSRELVRLPSVPAGGSWQFATDLLDAPSVHAHEPASPLDPRLMTGLGLGIAVAAALMLLDWRRRVRP